MTKRARLALAVALAALPLGGCVAAIPALYAGGIAMSKREQAARAGDQTSSPGASGDQAGRVEPAPRLTILPTKTLPPPGPTAGGTDGQVAAWDEFYGHALAAAARDPVSEGRKSALLAAPGLLAPETADCGIRPPAVAIDLDPAGGLFVPAEDLVASSRLIQVLSVLRSRGIDVFWVSDNFPDAAPAIRSALRASGLDPEARDQIVLLRYPDDRKQDRRASVGETHCLVAIAGDERPDFDELFEYLKSRDSALGLEPLIGDVWFLTPTPLAPNQSS